MITDKNIDHGKAFDWGHASSDYAKYRDVYPKEFYQMILNEGLCIKGQRVLDIGTGTGVLLRNLYQHGAEFVGIDISENQIAYAKNLAEAAGMKIDFQHVSAEQCKFPDESFDVITACQCFTYYDHAILAPLIHKLLKKNGKFVVLYMQWLPFDDAVAGKSEDLMLKYNPSWTGRGETRHLTNIPDIYNQYFEIEKEEISDIKVPFTRDSWNGRMKSCRAIGASLSPEEIESFDKEHRELLDTIAPEKFTVLHYSAITVMKKK